MQDGRYVRHALAFGGQFLQLDTAEATAEHRLDRLLPLGLVEPLEAVLEIGSIEPQIGIAALSARASFAVESQAEGHASPAARGTLRLGRADPLRLLAGLRHHPGLLASCERRERIEGSEAETGIDEGRAVGKIDAQDRPG